MTHNWRRRSLAARLGLNSSLVVQNAEGLVQSLDLLLTTCDTFLVGHASVDARGAKLLKLLKRLVQQSLFLAHVRKRVRDLRDGGGLLGLVVGLSGGLRGERHLGSALELDELGLGLLLRLLGLLDGADEVGLDDVEHAQNASGRTLGSSVGAREARVGKVVVHTRGALLHEHG